jgi:hypothetical protein
MQGKPTPVITVAVRSVYGNDLVYPADDAAALFASLIGAKTFNRKQLATIKALGYDVHVAAGQLPWALGSAS